MADINLIVGVDVKASLAGFQAGVDSLAKSIKPVKIRVEPDKASLKTFATEVRAALDGVSTKAGVAKGKSSGKGSTTIATAFSRERSAEMKRLNAINSTIASEYKKVQKELGGQKLTREARKNFNALNREFTNLMSTTDKVGESTEKTLGKNVKGAEAQQKAVRDLLKKNQEYIGAQKAAEDAAVRSRTRVAKELDSINKTMWKDYDKSMSILQGSTNKKDQELVKKMQTKRSELEERVVGHGESGSRLKEETTRRKQGELRSLINTAQKRSDIINSEIKAQQKGVQQTQKSTKAILDQDKVEKAYWQTRSRLLKAERNYTKAKNSSNAESREAYRSIKAESEALKSAYSSYRTVSPGTAQHAEAMEKLSKSTKGANTVLAESSAIMERNGDKTKSLVSRIGTLAGKFTSWLTVSQGVMYAVQGVRSMVQATIDIDTAMTELKKVTDETDHTYKVFLENASTRAVELGTTVSDVIQATAEFARTGFSLKESESLADAAVVYKNVGDGIDDITEASSSLISTIQAFNLDATKSMEIVDRFNEVGNNFAISSQGIGEALVRSASAMSTAGNTVDETIGLITAANTVVQDPMKVGTTLKTISMYLRAAKPELEAAGESTEGMAISVSKLRESLLALTKGKVDIQLDENNYKNTFQILKELSEVWDEIPDLDRANILEKIGGKNLPRRTVMCA